MLITLEPDYPNWLRLEFPYNAATVALVKTLPNRQYTPPPDGPYWTVPALPEVMDALIAHCGADMEPMDYEVLRRCYPAPGMFAHERQQPRRRTKRQIMQQKRQEQEAAGKWGKAIVAAMHR